MDLEEYSRVVRDLLTQYHDRIESQIMPKVSKDFIKLYMGITEIYGKLKNKGLIKDDPYLNNSDVMEILIPESEPFIDSEAAWKVPQRICKYISVLSYITHNYSLSLNNINFQELEKIKTFLDYYQWDSLLNPTVTEINTNSLGKLVISLRNGVNDSLIVSTIDKCIDTIKDSNKRIVNGLKYILLYLKESYKQFIREDIIPIVVTDEYKENLTLFLEKVIEEISSNYSYMKIYKKYINEVLQEEYSPEGLDLKERVLIQLGKNNKKTEVKKKQKVEDPNRPIIVTLLELGKSRNQLAAAIDKLDINHNTLSTSNRGFFGKISYALSRYLFNIKPKTIYKVTYTVNSNKKKADIHFEKFFADVRNLEFRLLEFAEEGRILGYISNHNDSMEKSIDKIILDIKRSIRNFMALDDYFKIELKLKGLKSKGIKPELTVLKTLLNSSTTLYREYLDTIEEKLPQSN